ncbi:MAG: RluA family pseudouridine synthase [Planctomycetes bacterium]|nr:RluA family pseudouridine synthase [Planctomycetota bacterium]
MTTDLEILYEDNHCLAVNKPAPLLTQAPPGIPSLEALVKEYLKEKHHKSGNVYLGVPHRLDRPVSGVILFARSSKAAQRLSEQFANQQVTKTYWGLVEGRVQPEDGSWIDWIRKVKDEPRAEQTDQEQEGAQQAVLRYHCLRHMAESTLLEFVPQTGRMHQIRLQAAIRGHPVLGDRLYGATLRIGFDVSNTRESVIALHARSLTFLHPIRYESVTVSAPLPALWHGLLPDIRELSSRE